MPRGKFLMWKLLTSDDSKDIALGLAYTVGKPKESMDLTGDIEFRWLKDRVKPAAEE
jgi:hypothetical protein